jgi:hypothetical protein
MRTTYHRRNSTKTSRMLDTVHASLRYGWATLPMIAAYIVVVSTTVLWYEPAPIVQYYLTVSKLDVYPGEEVIVNATVTRSKGGCDSMVTRTWTDGEGNLIVQAQYPIGNLPAGRESYQRPAVISPFAPIGDVWLQTEVEFFCNMVQRALGGTHFPLPDILFHVKPKTLGDGTSKTVKMSKEAYAGSFP